MNKIFSLPLNPKLDQKQFSDFVNFVTEYSDYIYDIYFTCRIEPFLQDAMGDVFVLSEHHNDIIYNAIELQKQTGITMSATFNNIHVPPTQRNLDIWIESFRPLYEEGIRSCTLPHTHWLSTGQIQKEFPELYVKNTILRNVSKANEVADLAKAGFNYVNLDRDLMRDRDTLVRVKKAADKYGIKLSLLANEGCVGGCIMMDEHYHFNNVRNKDNPQYFMDPISRVSCPKWDFEDPAIPLKTANFTPWKEDWDELLQFVDVFKMHGRENAGRLYESMDIIRRYANGQEILHDTFEPYINHVNLKGKPIQAWRKFIKNCKFECWDCNKCDKIFEARNGKMSESKIQVVTRGLVDSVNEPDLEIDAPGLTSPRVQRLLNNLARHSTCYLEVGSYLGATGCAAVKNNGHLKGYFVDNWIHQIQTMKETGEQLPTNTKETFLENIREFNNDAAELRLFDCDMYQVDLSQIYYKPDLFFYDGPHDRYNTGKAIAYYAQTLADEAILVFDDANFDGVVDGAKEGMAYAGLNVVYDKIVLNEIEDKKDWWNGLYIAVVNK